MLVPFLRSVTNSKWFTNFILLVIIFAGVLVGLETYPKMRAQYGIAINLLNEIVVIIFLIEVFIKMGAHGRQPWNYFKDPWNVFDFTIVAVSLLEPILPVDTSFVTVLRMARIVRVFRLITVLPKLQVLVGALLKSIPSMVYVGLFLGLLFYIYAVMAVFLFGQNDPWHFANLENSMITLFRVVTLEDWTDVMYINMYGCDQYADYPGACENPSRSPLGAAFFFISFVMIGTMIVLNLFIGVIMNSMNEVKAEKELEAMVDLKEKGSTSVHEDMLLINHQLESIKDELGVIRARLRKNGNGDQG